MKNILETTPYSHLEEKVKFLDVLFEEKDFKNKVVLDVGCGFGTLLIYALRKGAKTAYGIEISEEDLKTAKKYIKDEKIKLFQGSATNLPFEDNFFDTVVNTEVLEHIPIDTENMMFSEISRVLKKDGVVYLTTPYDSFWSKYTDPAFYLQGHRHYSLSKVRNYAENNKLKVEILKPLNGFWELLHLYNLYISKWVFRRERFFLDHFSKKRIEELKNQSKGFMILFLKAIKN